MPYRPNAHDAFMETKTSPSRGTLRGLDWLNFLLAVQGNFLFAVQTGVVPFLTIHLAGYKWNEESVGLALTVGGIAGILTQTPAGALVDTLRSKRALVGVAVAALASGALLIALFPSFWPVMGAQVLIDVTSSVFIPAICAMSLGIVGRAAFDTRQGRNLTFTSAGNVIAAVSMGLLGYFVSNRSIFFFVVFFALALAVPTILVLFLIRPAEIDYELARGGNDGEKGGKVQSVWVLLQDRPLVLFLVCAVMFYFANRAMLLLSGQLLAKGQGRSSEFFTSAGVVTTQFVITLIASWSGRKAGRWGRKPLLLIAFGVLAIRGVLYTLTTKAVLLVATRVMDGVGAGIFGVVSVLVIADLTRGTGRFNLTLGAITTAVAIGTVLGAVIAGNIVYLVGFRVVFLFLVGVALAAFAILYLFMPETHNTRLTKE